MSSVVATVAVGGFPNALALRTRNVLIDLLQGRGTRFLSHYPYAYVANYDGSVNVIRTSDNKVVKTIPNLGFAAGVKVSANGSRAYVLRMQGVTVIDTATNSVVGDIWHGTDQSYSLAISPNQKTLYIVEHGNKLYVIGIAPHTVSSVTVGTEPVDVEVSPDGAHVYTADIDSDTVTVVSTATNTVTATIAVGGNPQTVVASPDGTRLYVANAGHSTPGRLDVPIGTISVINTATNTVTATIAVGKDPKGIAVSPNGKRVYVTNRWDGVLLDPSTGDVAAEAAGSVSVINATTNQVIETITAGRMPDGIAVSPQGDYLYVANGNDGTVSVIKTGSEIGDIFNHRVLELIAQARRINGSWMVVGSKVIPIPPHPPTLAALAETAALHLDGAFDSPEIVEQLRRLQD